MLDYTAGRAWGCAVVEAAPYVLALGAVAVPAARSTWQDLPADTRARLRGEAREGADLAQEWVDTHPGQAQHVVDSSGGLLDGLLAGLPPGVSGRPRPLLRSTRRSATRRPTSPASTDPTARRRSGAVPTCRSGSGPWRLATCRA